MKTDETKPIPTRLNTSTLSEIDKVLAGEAKRREPLYGNRTDFVKKAIERELIYYAKLRRERRQRRRKAA